MYKRYSGHAGKNRVDLGMRTYCSYPYDIRIGITEVNKIRNDQVNLKIWESQIFIIRRTSGLED